MSSHRAWLALLRAQAHLPFHLTLQGLGQQHLFPFFGKAETLQEVCIGNTPAYFIETARTSFKTLIIEE